MTFALIYVTHSSLAEAKKIATLLLEERLIACVNYFPIESTFWWQGALDSTAEYVSLLKTQEKHWNIIQEKIREQHPYQTPCMMKLLVQANADYERWIVEETTQR